MPRASRAENMDVLIEATKESLKLTIRIGDYTRFKYDTIVGYVLPGVIDESVELSFHNEDSDFKKAVKAGLDQQQLHPWSIHKVICDPFPCDELIFIALPAWQGNYNKVLSSRISQILTGAVQMSSRTTNIAFCSFSGAPFNYPMDFYAHQMVSFLTDAGVFLNEHQLQRETFTVTLFTDNVECRPIFAEQLSSFGFHLEQSPSEQLLSDNKPKLITLEGPDYNEFLNQLYDNIHVSLQVLIR